MAIALYKPQVQVNGVVVFIKPNTFSFQDGYGERKTRVASGGGARKETYSTEDIETQFGMIKFVLYTTNEGIELKRDWQSRFNANTVSFIEGDVSGTMSRALMMNDPEVNAGVDGELEVTFHGDPIT